MACPTANLLDGYFLDTALAIVKKRVKLTDADKWWRRASLGHAQWGWRFKSQW